LIDNHMAGPILDMVSEGGDFFEHNFGNFKLKTGEHSFKLKGKGNSTKKRPSLNNKYKISISTLILLRIEDL
ncbi:MAG: hypothetical protein DRJ10_19200, partial [Bacteroidetes bacterium]